MRQTRYWFNLAAISQHFIIPGAVTIIMTVIGAILTLAGGGGARMGNAAPWRLLPHFWRLPARNCCCVFDPFITFGMLAMLLCMLVSVFILGVPYRGSLLILFLSPACFYSVPWGWGC